MKEREELFPYYYLNTRYNKFKNDKTFWLMSYSLIFKFVEPLSETEQAEFMEFLRSNAYEFSPFSVCNYFLKKRIEYRVKFKYSMTLSWDYNCANHECYKAVKRRLKKVEPYRWHTIYKNDKNYPKKNCECYVQTPMDFKTGNYHTARFNKKERKFTLFRNDMTGEIKYWQNAEYMGIDQII